MNNKFDVQLFELESIKLNDGNNSFTTGLGIGLGMAIVGGFVWGATALIAT